MTPIVGFIGLMLYGNLAESITGSGDFLLLDGSDFLLLDGSSFLLFAA